MSAGMQELCLRGFGTTYRAWAHAVAGTAGGTLVWPDPSGCFPTSYCATRHEVDLGGCE